MNKDFISKFLEILEELTKRLDDESNPKYAANLRTAERTFNFLLDCTSTDTIRQEFSSIEWTDIKVRRDKIANKLTEYLRLNATRLERYKDYCENLKDPSRLSSFL